jgi:uncharacterized protein
MTARVSFAARLARPAAALGWIAAFAALGLGASWGLAHVPLHPAPRWWLAWTALAPVVGFGIATALVGHRLDRRSWADLGWRPRTGLVRGFALGAGLGAAMAAGAVALAVLGGRAAVLAQAGPSAAQPWIASAEPLALGFLAAALSEELMFRGYPLRRLADAIGATPATAIAASGFGLAHLGNPSATVFSTLNVALAGVWLATAFFSPGGMPLAWGAHLGWNATLALGFAAPVSGYTFPLPTLAYHPGPHRWIDGGAFGPEAGIVSTLVLIAGASALGAWTRRSRGAGAP